MGKLVGLKERGIEGGDGLSGDGFYRFDYQRTYVVLADNLDETDREILQTPGLPPLGAYDLEGQGWITERRVTERDSTSLIRDVVVTFDSDPPRGTQQGEDPETPPDQRLPIFRWTSEVVEEIRDDDAQGRLIETTAGEQLPFSRPVTIPIMNITRWEYPDQAYPPDVILDFVNHVNQNDFYGAPQGTVLCQEIHTEPEVIDRVTYQKVDYAFKFKMEDDPDNPGQFLSDTWEAKILNYGTQQYYVDPASPGVPALPLRVVDILDPVHERPISKKLDSQGIPLEEGDDPIWLRYDRYNYADFDFFNFPGAS